jgi:hypothetical protein
MQQPAQHHAVSYDYSKRITHELMPRHPDGKHPAIASRLLTTVHHNTCTEGF